MNQKTINIRENAFDLLKLIGAFIVLFSHSFRHFGVAKPIWSLFFTDGSVGVMTFFAITGFVIMPAWERAQSKKHPFLSFIWDRIIRIYPGLLFMFLIISVMNQLVFGEDIFSISYIKYAIMFFVFPRGGAYGANGLGNGVIWTIVPDMVFYFLTPIIWKVMHNKKIACWILVILGFWQFNIFDSKVIAICQKIPFFGGYVDSGFSLCLLYEFLIGSFLYFHRDSIVLFFCEKKYYAVIYLLLASAIFVINSKTTLFPKIGEMHSPWLGIVFSPLIIVLGFAIGNIHLKIDLSYGIFLMHMLVVGTLKFFGISGVKGIVITFITTPIIALVFHYLVEKPTNRLKGIIK